MDPLMLNFIGGIIAGILGFITKKLYGFDIPKFASTVGLTLIMMLPIMFFYPTNNIEQSVDFAINYLVNIFLMLPGIIVGDLGGNLVSEFVDSFKR
jgi:hypothetical protein